MKKLMVLFFAFTLLFAQKMSKVAPVQDEFVNLSGLTCDTSCLQKLVKSGDLASFVASYDAKKGDKELASLHANLTSRHVVHGMHDVKIAVIVPEKVIKLYAKTISRTLLSYASKRYVDAKFKFYLTGDESRQALSAAVKNAQSDGFKVAIAPLTAEGVKVVDALDSKLSFYIPTLNKNAVSVSGKNFVFGGVDYKAQSKKLLAYSTKKIAAVSDNSTVSKTISQDIKDMVTNSDVFVLTLATQKIGIGSLSAGGAKMRNATIFLNTPTIKSAILASQIRVNNLRPQAILMPQLSYNPLLVSMAQELDLTRALVATSLKPLKDEELEAKSGLLNQNLNFDWITYSSAYGVEYLYKTHFNAGDVAGAGGFEEKVAENQVQYDVIIMEPTSYGFKEAVQKPLNEVETKAESSAENSNLNANANATLNTNANAKTPVKSPVQSPAKTSSVKATKTTNDQTQRKEKSMFN